MGHNEEAPAEVRRADFVRREQARFDAIAQVLKVADDLGGAQIEMALDILEEAPFRPDLRDDAADLRPQMPRVARAALAAGIGEGLAGISARDEMNLAAPRAAVEGSKVVP